MYTHLYNNTNIAQRQGENIGKPEAEFIEYSVVKDCLVPEQPYIEPISLTNPPPPPLPPSRDVKKRLQVQDTEGYASVKNESPVVIKVRREATAN